MISDLKQIKADAIARADAEIEEAIAERHGYLRGKLFTADGRFKPGCCNDAELKAIAAGLSGKKPESMAGKDDVRHGDQDLVDYVLGLPKDAHVKIKASIKKAQA